MNRLRQLIAIGLAVAAASTVAGAAPIVEEKAETDRAVSRARGLLLAGEAREAAAALEGIVAKAPAEPDAWYWLSECRRDLLDFAGAVAALREARRLDPRSAAYALALGNLHFVRLEKDAAFEQYESALVLDPSNAPARENIDRIRRERDDLDRLRSRRRTLFVVLLGETAALTSAVFLVCRFDRGRTMSRS